MPRYEIVFVVDAPDIDDPDDMVRLPWWAYIGEEPLDPDKLEYILVRPLEDDENTFDFLDEHGINVILEERHDDPYDVAFDAQVTPKKELPEWLRLVVDNEDDKGKDTESTPKE